MELRHLRYFAAVARNLSFSAAARAIHVAQPALSKTVRDLESELSVELLTRTRHVVKLTSAGSVFLREAERILQDSVAATHQAQRAARGEIGQLAIGFPTPSTAPFLPTVIREFHQAYPGVEISLHEVTPRELIQGMADERIDVGFTRPLPKGRHGLLPTETAAAATSSDPACCSQSSLATSAAASLWWKILIVGLASGEATPKLLNVGPTPRIRIRRG